MPASRPSPLRVAYFWLSLTMLIWAIGPLLIKLFTRHYDVWVMNGYRYGFSALLLLGWMLWRRGAALFRLQPGQWRLLLITTLSNCLMQITFAGMFYFIYPSVAMLVVRVHVPVTIMLSYLIFHDERQVIRSPRFLAGISLVLLGVVGVLAGQDPALLEKLEVGSGRFWIGVAVALGNAFFIATYTLSIRRLVRELDPMTGFTHVSWMTALVLVLLALALGTPSTLWTEPSGILALMTLSSVLGIAIGHTAYYKALRTIKASVSTTVLQLVPLVTCTLSALIYGDVLSPAQALSGLLILLGASLAALAESRRKKRGPTLHEEPLP